MRHDVVSMEDYTAGDERPLERCLRDVADCDVYVGVFAFRYGFVPAGHEASITELELRKAKQSGKPILAFLLDESAPWPPLHVDGDRGAVLRLRQDLETNHIVAYFETADQLATKVGAAVSQLELPGVESNRGEEDLVRKAGFFRTIVGGQIKAARYEQKFYGAVASILVGLGLMAALAGALLYDPVVAMSALIVPAASVFPVNSMVSRHKRSSLLNDLAAELEVRPPSAVVLREVEGLLNQSLGLVPA
jgi:hypothetical protein